MNKLMKYFEIINAEVNKDISLVHRAEVPEVMYDFYKTFGSVNLPYGTIYNLDSALMYSQRAPFYPNWFVFGHDNYFSFWLCFKGQDSNGYYFTCWDHEAGVEIDEPVCKDLLEFLKEMEEDSKEQW